MKIKIENIHIFRAEKAQGGFHQCINTWRQREWSPTFPSGLQVQHQKHLAESEAREVPSEQQEALPPCDAVIEPWHKPPRCYGVLSLEISKSHLDMGLGALLWVSLLEWWLDRWTQRWFPSSVILWFFDCERQLLGGGELEASVYDQASQQHCEATPKTYYIWNPTCCIWSSTRCIWSPMCCLWSPMCFTEDPRTVVEA